MRLTKEIEVISQSNKDGTDNRHKAIVIERKGLAESKLFELENIEDELGIDLILRHKIETSEKLYCRNNKGEIAETRYYYSYGKDGVGLELSMEIEPYWCVSSYPWKDYGKTWALTKEELL